MKIYIAADHAGFELKEALVAHVRSLGHVVEDCGAHLLTPNDDYPEIIHAAMKRLSVDLYDHLDSRGIVIGGSGQGEAMVANRFKGIRCAVYYGEAARPQTDAAGSELSIIESVRAHNDANVLSLGARFISIAEAMRAVETWLNTAFSNDENHVRRLWAIDSI